MIRHTTCENIFSESIFFVAHVKKTDSFIKSCRWNYFAKIETNFEKAVDYDASDRIQP